MKRRCHCLAFSRPPFLPPSLTHLHSTRMASTHSRNLRPLLARQARFRWRKLQSSHPRPPTWLGPTGAFSPRESCSLCACSSARGTSCGQAPSAAAMRARPQHGRCASALRRSRPLERELPTAKRIWRWARRATAVPTARARLATIRLPSAVRIRRASQNNAGTGTRQDGGGRRSDGRSLDTSVTHTVTITMTMPGETRTYP